MFNEKVDALSSFYEILGIDWYLRGGKLPYFPPSTVSSDAVSGLLAYRRTNSRLARKRILMNNVWGDSTISTLTLKRSRWLLEERDARTARDNNLRWDGTVEYIILADIYVYLWICLCNECFIGMEIFEFQAHIYMYIYIDIRNFVV